MLHPRVLARVTTALTAIALAAVIGLSNTASAALPTPPPTPAGAPDTSPGAHPLVATAATGRRPSPTDELFVAITPCRVADTRLGGGKLVHEVARNFYVAGTFGFAPQGGKAGGCGVPVGAAAVATNVTITNVAGPGNIGGYATGTTEPLSNFLSLNKGLATTANPVLPLASSSGPQLTLEAHASNTDVVIDVTGYYTEQLHALVYVNGTGSSIYSGSSHVLSVTNEGTGVADVTFDRDVTYCTTEASSDLQGHYALAFTEQSSSTVEVQTWVLNSTAGAVATTGYVYLTVTC